jgi:hypothetical protein
MEEAETKKDEHGPKNERPHDPPKKNLVLVSGRQAKVIKNEEKYKKVVYAEGFLKEITGQKLDGQFFSLNKINAPIEKQGNPDPHSAPDKRFFHLNFVSLSMKNPEV